MFNTYFIFSDNSLGLFGSIFRLEDNSQSKITYVDTDVQSRVEYHYKLKSRDGSNSLSEFSNTISYKLLPGIWPSRMWPNGVRDTLGGDRKLHWLYAFNIEMEDYCLTIINENSLLITREIFTPSDYTGGLEFWRIPNDIVLEHESIYRWRIDIAAKYVNGLETEGSESPWAPFLYVHH